MTLPSTRIQSMRVASRNLLPIFLACLMAGLLGCASVAPAPTKTYSAMTQVSTYPALDIGLYAGDVTYAQLEQAGDFGIGTFNDIDGEMIALDGKFYQAKADGSVHLADKTMKAPFAMVHFFQSKQQMVLKEPQHNYDQLKTTLSQQLPSANRPYAFRIAGVFAYLKIRSVPKQNEPYPPLKEVIARQAIFELRHIKGTLVGYWMPQYLAGLNVPGYHLHFVADDKRIGGHMLDCSLTAATVDIDHLDSLKLLIPPSAAFQSVDFTRAPK
jgi:acetolactate decarboxylase